MNRVLINDIQPLIDKIDFLRHICDILFQLDQLQEEHNFELYIGMKVLNVHCNLPIKKLHTDNCIDRKQNIC